MDEMVVSEFLMRYKELIHSMHWDVHQSRLALVKHILNLLNPLKKLSNR
jgi:hypothetical protein